ncbi:MAG: hypothetical protein K8T89_05705 [Planctomycetes bacterium]|nr:hypothetical protein [Planctomycetota bacterium]
MARMSREFSLVLLGAGILTAGYFFYRENNDLFAKEEEEAKKQASGSHHRTHSHMPLIFLHGGGYAGRASTSPAMASGISSRGGFGSIGAHASGGA